MPGSPYPDHNTEPAIVRYLERVKGFDAKRLRAVILPHEQRGLLKVAPGRIKCDGYELVCNGVVVVMII